MNLGLGHGGRHITEPTTVGNRKIISRTTRSGERNEVGAADTMELKPGLRGPRRRLALEVQRGDSVHKG